jgi:predicted RNA-binding Zn-ribbon protein involved in translation (DUF1610 family)
MVEIIPMSCPSCGAAIHVPDKIERYQCEYCGTTHFIRDASAKRQAQAAAPLRAKWLAPDKVRMTRDNEGSHIRFRWFSLRHIPMAIFCLFWDGFLIFWYSMVTSMGAPLVFALFPILHLMVGIAITYSTLAGFVNRTNIDLSRTELSVWFEPLLWFGEKTLKVGEIKQIYCKEKIVHGKNGTVTHRYSLNVLTSALRQVELLRDLDSPDLAMFLEQQLEEWMLIADQPIAGEMRKD